MKLETSKIVMRLIDTIDVIAEASLPIRPLVVVAAADGCAHTCADWFIRLSQ